MSSAKDLRAFEDGTLYLFTSLTAGSSHIITATSRLETILKANRIPFQAIDMATDEQARRLWQRRAQKKKIPGLVKDGFVIGDLEEVEEWNEFGELKENIGEIRTAPPSGSSGGSRPGVSIRPMDSVSPPRPSEDRADVPHPNASETASALVDSKSRIALPGAAEIAARNKAKSQSPPLAKSPPAIEAVASPMSEKKEPNTAAEEKPSVDAAGDASTTATTENEQTMDATKEPSVTAENDQSVDTAEEPAKPSSPKESDSAPAASEAQATATASPPTNPVSGPSDGVAGDDVPSTHRGSDVQKAPPEEIKKVESENALHEDAAEDSGLEKATQGVESVTFDDEPQKSQD